MMASKSKNHPVLPKCWDYTDPKQMTHVPPLPPVIPLEQRYRKGLLDVIACTHEDAQTLRIIAIAALGGTNHER